ncbi:hypothetical protein ACIPIN_21860 [Pseudomonas sp. NPDC087697]|uniref:hypothetical protein n=1 Tax=Pseudomonas sp. NPDC087697 TaxID=3364447 RepID=UPI00382130A6
MGVAQAGIAFRSGEESFTPELAVASLFGKSVNRLSAPIDRSFDSRHDHHVLVQQFGDIWIISNHALVWPILENPEHDLCGLHEILDKPALMIAFCQYDSGDSYGYALIEDGVLTRSRLQASGSDVRLFGVTKPFEQKWETAEFYLDEDDCPEEEWQKVYYLDDRKVTVPEYYLTSRLAYEALTENFGVCPWESDLKPNIWYLQLNEESVQCTSAPGMKVRKPWWKVW